MVPQVTTMPSGPALVQCVMTVGCPGWRPRRWGISGWASTCSAWWRPCGKRGGPHRPVVLRTVHQLRLSLGAIVRAIHQVARQAQPAVDRILVRCIRTSVPVVPHGIRDRLGANGYAWTFRLPPSGGHLRRGGPALIYLGGCGRGAGSFSGVFLSALIILPGRP